MNENELDQSEILIKEINKVIVNIYKIAIEELGIDTGKTHAPIEYWNFLCDEPLSLFSNSDTGGLGGDWSKWAHDNIDKAGPRVNSNIQLNNAATSVANILSTNGFSKSGIAGILGNAYRESAFNPSATAPNGAFGLWQFLGPLKRNLINYCNSNGMQISNPIAQTNYLISTLPNITINNVKNASNPADAAIWFYATYEAGTYTTPEAAINRLDTDPKIYNQNGGPGAGTRLGVECIIFAEKIFNLL